MDLIDKKPLAYRRWLYAFLPLLLLAVLVIAFAVSHARASPNLSLNQPSFQLVQVAGGLSRPTHVTHAGDGSGRLFVVEQRGRILVYDQDFTSTTFLDIRERVRAPGQGGGNEEGLLSVAFPPGFSEKRYFYVYYTMLDGDNLLSRFHLAEASDLADPNSQEEILVFPHPQFTNHNGGQLAFGPGGYLYIGTGDGGGAGDPFENAQDPASLLGKILRIDVENNHPYEIPPDNPFVDLTGYRPEIWALGLRNPWRFSFDRSTGDLYIADVGQQRWEEVNFQPASSPGGENYGWNIMEGPECYEAEDCDQTGLTLPVHAYRRISPHCSVTGGFVFRKQGFSDHIGNYIFGDFCSGNIWELQRNGEIWQSHLLAETTYLISTFGEDERGSLYLADHAGGSIYRLIFPSYNLYLPVVVKD
jgi:glucose/arabinose dehydrogenase